jgi:hypothetical protein
MNKMSRDKVVVRRETRISRLVKAVRRFLGIGPLIGGAVGRDGRIYSVDLYGHRLGFSDGEIHDQRRLMERGYELAYTTSRRRAVIRG